MGDIAGILNTRAASACGDADKHLARRIEQANVLSMVKKVSERWFNGALYMSDSHHRAGATYPTGENLEKWRKGEVWMAETMNGIDVWILGLSRY